MTGEIWQILIMRKPLDKTGNTLSITPQMSRKMGYSQGKLVTVKIGTVEIQANVLVGTRGKSLVEAALLLDSATPFLGICGRKLRFTMEDNGEIQIGPIIGIFTYHDKNSRRTLPFGAQNNTLKNLVLTGHKNKALVYVFTPDDIKGSNIIWGRAIDEKSRGNWQQRPFPMPNVVYDRIPTRKDEARSDVQHAKAKLISRPEIKYFNPQFLDKWHVYKFLVPNVECREFLPETTLYTDCVTVINYLKKYRLVYLKPTASSIGRGIIRIELHSSKVLLSYKNNQGRNVQKVIASLSTFSRVLTKLIGQRKYLVQQGILMAKYKGNPFDVRLLAQKDVNGRWQVTGMAARVAGNGSITTHIPNGGTSRPLEKVLKHAFRNTGIEISDIISEITTLAKTLPPVLEAASGKLFGELSMDIGVDTTGRAWLFELNSKPFRFDEPQIRLKSWDNLIKYASTLSGFNKE